MQADSGKRQSMRKLNLALCALLLAPTFNLSLVLADHGKAPEPPPNVSSPELNRIKSLAGRWSSTTSMFGKKDEQVFTEYSVTAGGSAVLERIFPGTPNEMVSVYYDDDKGKLAMTHYCIMRNRPHFKLAKSDKDEIKMDVTKIEGLKSKHDPSMGAITLHFDDKDHFTSTCAGKGKSEGDQGPMAMRYTRVE